MMASIEIFMGAPVEWASERAAIERAYALADGAGEDAVILANFIVGGRQIDALVGTSSGAVLLEAKGVSSPIDGDVNGSWRMNGLAGVIPVRNGYVQAVEAKNRLHDAMRTMSSPAPYPDACVVMVPARPPGSTLTKGDHKAAVIDLDALTLPRRTGAWPIAQWKAFAARSGLEAVQRLPALFDPALLEAEQSLDAYGRLFLDTYGPRAQGLLPFPCEVAGETVASDALGVRLADAAGLILIGPSGCGKSLAGLKLAIEQLGAGEVPIVLEAKLFEGQLRSSLDREAGLLGLSGFSALTTACWRLGRRLLMLVDGYNECPPDQRFALTRALGALVRRSGARVVATSQVPLEGALLQPLPVHVPRPALTLKRAIARGAAGASLSASTEALLDAAASGLEARMLGEVGGELPSGASRFALFDLYVRRRLGRHAAEGVRTLAMIAGLLAERLSFSLSIRDFDRLRGGDGSVGDGLTALFEAGLLQQRGDRLSFGHELFLQAFQAEALVRRAKGDAAEIVAALDHPLFAPAGALVLGAIDDPALLAAVLASITDARLFARVLAGDCGEVARLWAEAQCERLFQAARAEVDGASFEIHEISMLGVRPNAATLRAWSKAETAILSALPDWLARSSRLPRLLDAARAADGRLVAEHRRLAPEARERRVALRSGLFGQVYVETRFGLSHAFGANAGLHRWCGTAEELADVFTQRADTLSHGEAYVLLQLSRGQPGISRLTAPLFPALLGRLWVGAPYHLKLSLLEAAGFCWQAEDADRLAVIQALEDLGPIEHIMLSTQWIEAMEQLGGLEADAERELESLRHDMPAILAQPEDPGQQHQAWSLYYRRFDHPLSSAYCKAFDELTPPMRLQVLSMAARVAEIGTFFAGPLLADLALAAEGESEAVAPLARWAILPSPDAMMPQEALANYLMAHMILARSGLEPPSQVPPEEPAGRALIACAAALCAANRPDLTATEREARVASAWSALAAAPGPALVALAECSKVDSETLRRLPGARVDPDQIMRGHEADVALFARTVLANPELMSGWFRPRFFEPGTTIRFALSALGRWGDAGDLSRLRAMTRVTTMGEQALQELQRLEERLFKAAASAG